MASTKVALVTASSAGLGAAIAIALARDMRVVINYQSSLERANAVLKLLADTRKESGITSEVSQQSPQFLAIRADMGKRSEIRDLVTETVEKMGRLDVVVSNAGWTRITNFTDLDENVDEDDWDRCFNINVKSHVFLLHAAKEHLEKTEGSFVTVASVAGVKPSGSSLPYAVTKGAQIYLVKCLASIVSPKIRVNSVSPGLLMTDWGRQFSEERINVAKEKTLLKRFAEVEDVAEQVRLLALSRSTTGINVVLDAGFSV